MEILPTIKMTSSNYFFELSTILLNIWLAPPISEMVFNLNVPYIVLIFSVTLEHCLNLQDAMA